MASKGNKKLLKGIPKIKDAFIVLVKTEWNSNYTNLLERGAMEVLKTAGIQTETIIVPGAVEIPFAIQAHYVNSSKPADAYIALGCVIKGGTPHFEYVCSMVANGVSTLNLGLSRPVIFGVLTLNTDEEAQERTGGTHGNKGEEAAITAIKMISLHRKLLKS